MLSSVLSSVMALVATPGAVLAHQGGWDEILMVVVPIGVFALLLRAANRRAGTMGEPEEHEGPKEV